MDDVTVFTWSSLRVPAQLHPLAWNEHFTAKPSMVCCNSLSTVVCNRTKLIAMFNQSINQSINQSSVPYYPVMAAGQLCWTRWPLCFAVVVYVSFFAA